MDDEQDYPKSIQELVPKYLETIQGRRKWKYYLTGNEFSLSVLAGDRSVEYTPQRGWVSDYIY